MVRTSTNIKSIPQKTSGVKKVVFSFGNELKTGAEQRNVFRQDTLVRGQSAATCVGTHDSDSVPHSQGVPFYAGAGIKSPGGAGGKAPASRRRLPSGHRFFGDCEREQCARWLDWAMHLEGDCWFSTTTFRNYVSVYRANKMTRRWLARMNQAHKDINEGRQLKSFCATEWQKRDVIHYHLLLLGTELGNLSRKRWECRWESNGGGFARNYDAVMKAAPYLAKYMNKRLGGEVDIGGAWLGTMPPKSIGNCCRK